MEKMNKKYKFCKSSIIKIQKLCELNLSNNLDPKNIIIKKIFKLKHKRTYYFLKEVIGKSK